MDKELHDLAMQYHRMTEEYDMIHCVHRRNGAAIPTTTYEQGLCSRNARHTMFDLLARTGLDRSVLQKAISLTAKEFEDALPKRRIG